MVWVLPLFVVCDSRAAPMGTAFTYQGRLIDANNPADGLYDFLFRLYDANVTGTQKGSTINIGEVDVIDGYFTVELDFGSKFFDGDARWLETSVRPGELKDPNTYTVLVPRQKVQPVPYALYAGSAASLQLPVTWMQSCSEPLIWVENLSNGSALVGISENGTGIRGVSWGSSYNDTGVNGYSDYGIGVRGENGRSGNWGFLGGDTTAVYGYGNSGYAGQFDGDVQITGDIRATGTIYGTISGAIDNADKVDGYHAGNSSGQVAVSNGTLCTNLNADKVDGYHVSDLDGRYVNEGQSNSITSAMIQNGTIQFADLGQNGAASGQVVKWNGSAWVAAADLTGGGGLTLPYAGAASTDGSAFSVSNTGNGIGMTGEGTSTSGYGVRGVATGSTGRGVYGLATNTGNFTNYGGYFTAAGGLGRGVYGYASNSGDYYNYYNYGGYFEAAGGYGRGVYGVANNSGNFTNYGGFFQAAGGYGMGVRGYASNSGNYTNFGGYFVASGSTGRGVYGYAAGSSAVGVYGYGGEYDFYAAGPGTDYGAASSIRWKRDIRPIDEAIGKVMMLRGVYFNWDAEHGGGHDVGMVAEEVGEVLPEIVEYEENGTDATGMDYGKLTPLLVEAVKALKSEVDELREQNKRLEERLVAVEKLMGKQALEVEGGQR